MQRIFTKAITVSRGLWHAPWAGGLGAAFVLLCKGMTMAAPLHDAVQADDLKAARYLLRAGADIEAPNPVGHTPLHLAKSVPMARWLIGAGANLEAVSGRGYTPLLLAAAVAPEAVVSTLASAGAMVRARNTKNGFSILHYLAWSTGREELAREMIDAGAEVNARGKTLRTPLHVAANNLIVPFTGLLLDHGGDPNALDEDGFTPFMLALTHFGLTDPDPAFLDTYLRAGFDPNVHGPTGLTALHLAASRDRMHAVVGRLIALGADIETEAELPGYDVSGFRPLHAAAWLGMAQTVTALLEQGADLRARTSDGRTALHWVASPLRVGQPQTVFLVRELAGVFDTHQPYMSTGQGPRRPILRKDGLPAARTLIGRGAELDARDAAGRTPLETAREAGYPETVAYLQGLQAR